MSINKPTRKITIERTYQASLQDLWDLWTTNDGIESWWGPGGFTTRVLELDLRVGGKLHYEMTATGAEQVTFMTNAGMPLTIEGRINYTEVVPLKRLGYTHLADFIPGVEPYDVATLVEFHSLGQQARMVLTFDAMHNDEWTQRSIMGQESQLAKLENVIGGRRSTEGKV
jgi:uncharacterized protein YndB with AHSA1/START domain